MRILLLLIFLPFSVSGQQLEWSNARKLKGTSVFTKVIGENSNGIYLLRTKTSIFSKQLIVEHYRNHLGLEATKSMPLKRQRLVSANVNENGPLIFTSRYNKVTQMNELSGYYLNGGLEPVKEPEVVDAAPISDFYDRGDFTVRYSVTQNRILVYHSEKTDDKELLIHLEILDRQLKHVSSKRVQLPFPYEEIVVRDLHIDDSGNVYLLITHQAEVHRRTSNPVMTHSLYCYYPDTDQMEDYLLSDSSTFLLQPRISFDRNNHRVNVTAFYSHTFFNTFTGVYFFSLGRNQDPVVYLTPFSEELISLLIGKVRMERGGEVSDFQVMKAIPSSDGGVILVAERASVSADEDILIVSGVAQTMTRNIYNYDDILVVALDSAGAISWHHVIYKNQSSMNDGGYFGSIVVAVTPANIHIIYNDKMRGNGDIMQISIDGTGAISSKILIKSERNFISVIPSEARQIGANELLLPTMRDKKFALLKLVYDK